MITLMTCLCTVMVSGSEQKNHFIVENYNLIEEYSLLLAAETNSYGALDATEEKTVSKSVATKINLYRKALLDLQSHADVESRILENEVKLAYEKGVSIGRLAWIYYYNLSTVNSEASRATLLSTYESLEAEIKSATDAAVTKAESDGLCAVMNRAVYREKIKGLALTGDTLECSALIAGALDDIELINSSDNYATELRQIYEELIEGLALQRCRDSLMSDLRSIFTVVRAGETFEENEAVWLFAHKLNNTDSIADMNSAFCSAISELTLESDESSYRALFAARLNASISEAAAKATSEKKAASVLPLFEDYSFSYEKAKVKDEIKAILGVDASTHPELQSIEKKFNADGGSVDKCKSTGELKAEKTLATYQKRLFDELASSLEKLEIILGASDPASFADTLEEIYRKHSDELYSHRGKADSISASCEGTVRVAGTSLAAVLNEAKAHRFLTDHKYIITKPKEELSLSDEIYLRSALTGYTSLEAAVRAELASQINIIAEKYSSVMIMKIHSLAPQDVLYLDLCESICEEIKSIPRTDIAVFYGNVDRVFSKASSLCEIISYYREIYIKPIYKQLNENEKAALLQTSRDFANRICALDVNDKATFAELLAEAKGDASLALHVTVECARVRISTRGSENVSVLALLTEARGKIQLLRDRTEITALADKTIFKIERHLTSDAILAEAERTEHLVSSMKFLDTQKKTVLTSRIRSLRFSASSEALISENLTVLSFIWSNFREALDAIFDEAQSEDLSGAKKSYVELFDGDIVDFKTTVLSLSHISAASREEYLNSAISLNAKLRSEIASLTTSSSVADYYAHTLELLSALLSESTDKNLSIYKDILCKDLESYRSLSENYSAQNYTTLLEKIESAKVAISHAATIAACDTVLSGFKNDLKDINTVLDDAKESALVKLEALWSSCLELESHYSKANLDALKSHYNEAAEKIRAFEKISDVATLQDTLKKALALMNDVRKNIIFTGREAFGISVSGARYPASYDLSRGLWGSISLDGGIYTNASLTIKKTSLADAASLESIIRRAAKDKSIRTSESTNAETLKLLRSAVISFGFDATLSRIQEAGGEYTLELLLPDGVDVDEILGIVFVSGEGVEFFEVTKKERLITCRLSHLSEFFIVSRKTTNLLPLITFLIVLLAVELVALMAILFIRYNRKRKEEKMTKLSSFTPLSLISAFSLTVTPKNGVGIAVLLAIAALALGCTVAFLTKVELEKMAEAKRGMAKKEDFSPDERLLAEGHSPALPLEEPVFAYLPVANDSEAAYANGDDSGENEYDTIEAVDYEDGAETYEGDEAPLRREEINIDIIERKFREGDLVTVEALKQKHLISKKANYVKILARGSLSKPLTIEAHDFSHAAEEMLRAIGGEAIRIK